MAQARQYSALKALAALMAMNAANAWATDCVFDQAAQLARLRELASKHPGARLDTDSRSVTWAHGAKTLSITEGGCAHYTQQASLTRKRSQPATPEQLRHAAAALATHMTVEPGRATRRRDGGSRQHIQAPRCVRIEAVDESGWGFYIEHGFDAGLERITLGYQQD